MLLRLFIFLFLAATVFFVFPALIGVGLVLSLIFWILSKFGIGPKFKVQTFRMNQSRRVNPASYQASPANELSEYKIDEANVIEAEFERKP